MRVQRRKFVRRFLAAGIVAGTLGVVGFAPAAVSGATTAVTLYVRTGATGHSCTASTATHACGSIGNAVTVARHETGTVTITVGPGTFFTLDVTLSTGGESSLTIKGPSATFTYLYNTYITSVFVLQTGNVPVTIEGASVAGGTGCPGGGIASYPHHTIVLRDDTFRLDYACTGGAVYLAYLSHATFIDDTFTTDSAPTGGAVDLFTDASASFTGDTFTTDSATTGGAVNAFEASASFTGDTFTRDHAANCGGGVELATGATVSFSGDTFTDDNAGCGGAIAVIDGATGTVSTSAVGGSCFVFTATLTGTNDVLSATAVTSCGMYFHSAVSANCLPRAIACDSSFARPGKSVAVDSRGASATYTGHGAVSIGTFRSDPVGAFGGSGATFFGVSISTGTGATSLVISVPSADAGNALMWWSGSKWLPVDAIASCGTTSCDEFIFSATSTPSLATIVKLSRTSRFGGVIFAIE